MAKTAEAKETPLMKQYNSIKGKYPDAILLFRVGDFYETFGDDAVRTSKVLGIVLTRRANGSASHIELAGFPHHSLDSYLPKLVRAGYRVAICDQLEDPKLVKGIVKRGITELVTPGVSFNEKVLDHRQNNYLAAVHFEDGNAGLAVCDVSTGEFHVAQGTAAYIDKLLESFRPSEVLYQKHHADPPGLHLSRYHGFPLDDWAFAHEFGYEKLTRHFETHSLKGFGIEDQPLAIAASGAILHYLSETKHDRLRHISSVSRIDESQHVWLDKFTLRNLEIFSSNHPSGKALVDVIDRTATPMGSRLLRRWLAFPLRSVSAIHERLNAVDTLVRQSDLRDELVNLLKETGDLERLISKVAAGRVNPRELMQLNRSLALTDRIKTLLHEPADEALLKIAGQLNGCAAVQERLTRELHPDAPASVQKGQVIREGVSAELDELRQLSHHGKDHLLHIQQREIARTGISSLKVAYNNVFGYYLEVTHVHREKVPADWMRKQTLTNAERYITPELKEYEEKILGAEERIAQIELRLYEELVQSLSDYLAPIQLNASLLARLDVLCGFAVLAADSDYHRPELDEGYVLDITEGRHPVIEKQLPLGVPYVSNSVRLDNDDTQIMMITGPNMSGKSALLRQTALIVLLAQCGSFVPAASARLGITDKIFTRVGATDNISSGESTFMVEMIETASILNNLSARSLVLLDEIGRGTSTYDGISIAWSIAEYLHNQPERRAKTLFATHYHELNEMSHFFPRIRNFNVSVKETGNRIIFLRKLQAGGSEHSFGIHVARLAGMPASLIERAGQILRKLEREHEFEFSEKEGLHVNDRAHVPAGSRSDMQLSFFQLNDPVLQQIKDDILQLDINTLTPVEALLRLSEIKRLVGG